MSYIVTVRRGNSLEEYDGGKTIAEARKEASFFAANTPEHVTIKICVVKDDKLKIVEVIRGTWF